MIQIPVVEIALLKFICLLSIVHASDEVIQETKILELILEIYNLCGEIFRVRILMIQESCV